MTAMAGLILIQSVKLQAAAPATQPAPAAKLDFRIAAEIGQGDKPVDNLLPRKLADELIRQLNDKGPQGQYDRPSGFDWFDATDTDTERLVSGVYKNQRYLLLMTSEPYTMLAEHDGRRTWGFKDVYLSKNQMEQTCIGFEFDATGAEQFGKLTETNLERCLAVLVDGKVIAVPKINTKIGDRGIIEGGRNGYDPATAKRLVDALRQGMPSVPSSPAAAEPPASGPRP
jgi:preprotein translocase subunit SecD